MALNAIQSSSNQNSKKKSILSSAATGAVVGYALKWAIPVTISEKDSYYNSNIEIANKRAAKAGREELTSIQKLSSSLNGADEFLKMHNEGKVSFDDLKPLEKPLADNLMTLYSRVKTKITDTRLLGYQEAETLTKSIRPTGAFIGLGAGIGLFSALICNLGAPKNKVNSSEFSKDV